MSLSLLEKAILRTLAYFNLGAYPLTANEIWQFLHIHAQKDLKVLLVALDSLKNKNLINEKHGFYFLIGYDDLVERRRAQLVVSELKLKKARKAIKFIQGVPFLKAVFVCNTVSAGTAVADSDIDFFIIAAKNRLYIVRFFTNLILRLFGLRTYGDSIADRICLSFFVDDQNLNLEKLKAIENDVHFAYWIAQMVPVYDPQNYFKKFLSANFWLKDYLPNFLPAQYQAVVIQNKFFFIWQIIWETMWRGAYGDLIEKQTKEWQMLKMKLSVKEKAKKGDNSIVINNGVLKLHENDTRRLVYENWQKKIKELCL